MLFILAFILLVGAVLLLQVAQRRRQASGLPAGRIVYSDMRGWQRVEAPLFDPLTSLTGRPDYLVEQKGQIIPIEVKSSHTPTIPYESHIYQLAAYCRLVQVVYGKRPPYGLLHYPDRTFEVDYTPQLEAHLLDLLEEMRQCTTSDEASRSHDSAARCQGCGYQSICDQKLG
jgi:CRISPR-associated exonuclease Cas4